MRTISDFCEHTNLSTLIYIYPSTILNVVIIFIKNIYNFSQCIYRMSLYVCIIFSNVCKQTTKRKQHKCFCQESSKGNKITIERFTSIGHIERHFVCFEKFLQRRRSNALLFSFAKKAFVKKRRRSVQNITLNATDVFNSHVIK